MGVSWLGLKLGPGVEHAKDTSGFGGGGTLTVLMVGVASLEEG
jgi:hypothetical protein